MKISKWIVASALMASAMPAAWAQTYVFKFGSKMPLDNTDDLYATMPDRVDFATLEYESASKRFTLRGTGLKNFGPGNSKNLGPTYDFRVWKVVFDIVDDWTVYNRLFSKLSMNHSGNIFVLPEAGAPVDNLQFMSTTVPFDLGWGNMGWMLHGSTNIRNFVGDDESVSWTLPDFDPTAIKGWPSPKAVALRVVNVAPGIARQAWYQADAVDSICNGVPCSQLSSGQAVANNFRSSAAPVTPAVVRPITPPVIQALPLPPVIRPASTPVWTHLPPPVALPLIPRAIPPTIPPTIAPVIRPVHVPAPVLLPNPRPVTPPL